ncbi:MAG: hypothetical protein JSU90_11940 [Nitrospiraceae bacterium]|nr:MAG: hypothetical protein JSU90_11940 [Nitrospiraceae bacterium]
MNKDLDKELIDECYRRSLELLKTNCRPEGINAALKTKKADTRHYASIFGRDAAICSLGMVASEDRHLIRCAKNSLLTLAKFQAPNGQIAKFVKPEKKEVDFWYTGCIDATLWWLIAVDFYDRAFPGEKFRERLKKKIHLALYWLHCQEHQGLYLLQQNEASDWADIMPRTGFVLYSNALWYRVKEIYGLEHALKTRHFFRYIFFPFDKAVPANRRARIMAHYVRRGKKRDGFYLSFVNFAFWGPEIDVYANILSMLFGLSPLSRSARRVEAMLKLKVNEPWPVKVVHDPLRQNSPLWRTYMERYRQNYPWQYHNGGIWPFVAGFWVTLLNRVGKKRLAWRELERYAKACSLNNWEFNEWLHGRTGKPMGMAGQSWNASMFIFAWHCLKQGVRL